VCVRVCWCVCVDVWACAGAQENELPAYVCVCVCAHGAYMYGKRAKVREKKFPSPSLPHSLSQSHFLSRVYTHSKCSHVCVHTYTNADACVNICTSKHFAQPTP
jgi:hypothetical protein